MSEQKYYNSIEKILDLAMSGDDRIDQDALFDLQDEIMELAVKIADAECKTDDLIRSFPFLHFPAWFYENQMKPQEPMREFDVNGTMWHKMHSPSENGMVECALNVTEKILKENKRLALSEVSCSDKDGLVTKIHKKLYKVGIDFIVSVKARNEEEVKAIIESIEPECTIYEIMEADV